MEKIKILSPKGERLIGTNEPAFIVAELSANHNQDFDTAVAIIKGVAKAGADAIKLQTYTPDTLTIDCDKEWFIVKNKDNPEAWKGQKLYDLYKNAFTPWEWHVPLQKIAEELGLIFFSTPYDQTAVDFLEKLNVPCHKIASYEATDFLLLRAVAKTRKPVIMSVGFATKEEIAFALETLKKYGSTAIVVLFCNTAYAAEPESHTLNLATMLDIREQFGVEVGFSDNNGGVEVPIQAALMGATIIEKHVVLHKDSLALDARFSLDLHELKIMVDRIRLSERVKGVVTYGVQNEQEKQNTYFRRSLFVVKNIKKGELFSSENVRSIRPSMGLPTRHFDEIIGKPAATDILFGTPLSWELISKK